MHIDPYNYYTFVNGSEWLVALYLSPRSLYLSWLLNNKHYYSTSLCRNKAKHKASHLLTLSLVSVFMCVCVCKCVHTCIWTCIRVRLCVNLWVRSFYVSVYVRRECLQGCQRRFKIFSLLSAPTHFSLCTAAQICKSSLLRMQSTRSASIYSILLSPSLCTHPLSLCSLCSLPFSLSLLLSPLSPFCLWFSVWS